MALTLGGYFESGSVTTTQWLAILLVVATGLIHVSAGLVEGRLPVSLAGVGFLVAAGLFRLDYRRPLLYLMGILYTAVQFPIRYVARTGECTVLGYADKTSRSTSLPYSHICTGAIGGQRCVAAN